MYSHPAGPSVCRWSGPSSGCSRSKSSRRAQGGRRSPSTACAACCCAISSGPSSAARPSGPGPSGAPVLSLLCSSWRDAVCVASPVNSLGAADWQPWNQILAPVGILHPRPRSHVIFFLGFEGIHFTCPKMEVTIGPITGQAPHLGRPASAGDIRKEPEASTGFSCLPTPPQQLLDPCRTSRQRLPASSYFQSYELLVRPTNI